MRLSQLLQDVQVRKTNLTGDPEITGVSVDSRQVRPGDLFVAIPGFATDGSRFIPDALSRGARVVLCQQPPADGATPYVLVSDARAAEAAVAANWYDHPARQMTLVGVTGTNGKTTVTYLLKTLLERTLGATVGLIGTIQNLIGDRAEEATHTTPDAMALQGLLRRMADAGCTHVVMEVSSHALALHRVDGLTFAAGIFTNLTQDHLDFHGTMEAYGQAKAMLFPRCGAAVLNVDDPAWTTMAAACACLALGYGQGETADLQAQQVELAADHVAFEAVTRQERVPVRLGIPGGFTVYNALAALGAAMSLGVSLPAAAAALADAHGVKGRVEVVPTPGQPYTVLIDYAHTPDGLENVLRTVRGFAPGRTVAVFGCGGDRDATKRPIMGRIAGELADFVVVTSDNPRTEAPGKIIEDILAGMQDATAPYVVVENRRAAIRWAMTHAQPGDVIVLAGKGHETYQILGTEKTHLDEREEVAACLAELEQTGTTEAKESTL